MISHGGRYGCTVCAAKIIPTAMPPKVGVNEKQVNLKLNHDRSLDTKLILDLARCSLRLAPCWSRRSC